MPRPLEEVRPHRGQSLLLPFVGVFASTPYSKNGLNISSQLCSAQ